VEKTSRECVLVEIIIGYWNYRIPVTTWLIVLTAFSNSVFKIKRFLRAKLSFFD